MYKVKGNSDIYLPMSPSEWLEDSLYICNCMVVTMSYGRGVSTEVIRPTDLHNGLNYVENVHGEHLFLNMNFMIKVEWKNFVSVKYHTKNINHGEHIKRLEFIVDENVKIRLSDKVKLLENYTVRLS